MSLYLVILLGLFLEKSVTQDVVRLELGDGVAGSIEFDGEWSTAEELGKLAKDFVSERGPLLGQGCSTAECVASVVCGEMGEISAEKRLARVHNEQQTSRVYAATEGAARLRGIAEVCCVDEKCPVYYKIRNAERKAALAEASGSNWLGANGFRRGLEAAERALAFADTEEARQEAGAVRDVFAGLIDTSFHAFEERTYGTLLRNLTHLLYTSSKDKSVAYQEGGLVMSHLNLDSDATEISNVNIGVSSAKRECWVQTLIASAPSVAIEIGFNLGHSAAMLLSLTNASLIAFDICRYDYTLAARELLMTQFSHRFDLFCGDSSNTLPAYFVQHHASAHSGKNNASLQADFIFIDGSHYYDAVVADIRNARLLASHDALVIVDDCTGPVYQAWQEARHAGLLRDRHRGLCWRQLCIGYFIKE